MDFDLVLDIGNTRVKGAFFKDDTLVESFALQSNPLLLSKFESLLGERKIRSILLSSVNEPADKEIQTFLKKRDLPFYYLSYQNLGAIVLDVLEPELVGHDRIANCYGALFHFPHHDCLVIDIGTAVTFDYVTKEGKYKGGAIYPGMEISAKGLANYTNKLPNYTIEKPPSALGKTTKEHIQSGIYYGLLGAIERIVAELKTTSPSPSSVQVLLTGGASELGSASSGERGALIDDLKDLVDFIDPYLTLVGLHEILKEYSKKKE